MIDKILARFSFWTGVLAPLGGIAILLLYMITEKDIFPMIGLLYFYSAILLNIFAFGALAYIFFRRRSEPENFFLKSLVLKWHLIFLISSYPLGVACAVAGMSYMETSHVVVYNQTETTLKDLKLVDSRGREVKIEDIPSGSHQGVPYRARGDASVKLHIGSLNKEVTVFGYVTSAMNLHSRVEVTDDEVKVTESDMEKFD